MASPLVKEKSKPPLLRGVGGVSCSPTIQKKIEAKTNEKDNKTMTTEPEAILEDNLVKQLQSLGYEKRAFTEDVCVDMIDELIKYYNFSKHEIHKSV